MSVLRVNGRVRLTCNEPGCRSEFIPRGMFVDVTGNAQQLAELHQALRDRARQNGWRSMRAAAWVDLCPKHPKEGSCAS